MEPIVWKLRVSMLWIFLGVGQLAAILAAFFLPDVLGEYIATGELEGSKIDATYLTSMLVIFSLLPLAMAFLTLALRDPINRYLNAILSVLITAGWAFAVAEHLSEELAISSGVVMSGTLTIAGLLIAWHAWRWPRPVEQGLGDRRPAAKPEHPAAGTA